MSPKFLTGYGMRLNFVTGYGIGTPLSGALSSVVLQSYLNSGNICFYFKTMTSPAIDCIKIIFSFDSMFEQIV